MLGEINDKEFQDFLAETRTQFSACIEGRKRQVDQTIAVISDIARAVCGEPVDVYAKATADKVEFNLQYSITQGSLGGFEFSWWGNDKPLFVSHFLVRDKITRMHIDARPILAKKLLPVEKETT